MISNKSFNEVLSFPSIPGNMKNVFSLFLLCFALLIQSLQAQNNFSDSQGISILGPNEKNDASIPCISPQEYEMLERRCAENIRTLNVHQRAFPASQIVQLDWPIKAAAGFNDCSFYFIAAYVDQNTAATSTTDFNCGTNTYDGHHGTDIAIWPFGFFKMDYDQVEVVAAAAGMIIDKADGNFDRNCSSNNLTANYVIVQHADSSRALYWHMKKNSVTSKTVGQMVVAGEYLGVVGSSGSSSGPHLHFEVWSGNNNTTYKDPFYASCNTLNASTWWAAQKPYTEPSVIKVSVNTTDIVLPGCPTTETTNESDTFSIPFQGPGLPAGAAKFYIFIRNETSGMTADCQILNPDNTVFNSWTYTSTANNKTNIRGFTKTLPTVPGTYTFQSTYNGIICSKSFDITNTTAVESPEKIIVKIYTTNSDGILQIDIGNAQLSNGRFEIFDLPGRKIYQMEITDAATQIRLNSTKGIYLYKLTGNGRIIATGKFIIR